MACVLKAILSCAKRFVGEGSAGSDFEWSNGLRTAEDRGLAGISLSVLSDSFGWVESLWVRTFHGKP
jgi:hypothetical protein